MLKEAFPFYEKHISEEDFTKLKKFFRTVWLEDTAEEEKWDVFHPELGHSAITALVLQDHFGGDILRRFTPIEGYHYWNKFSSGQEIDLTISQFDSIDDESNLTRKVEAERFEILAIKDTKEKYDLLSKRVDAYLELGGISDLQELIDKD